MIGTVNKIAKNAGTADYRGSGKLGNDVVISWLAVFTDYVDTSFEFCYIEGMT